MADKNNKTVYVEIDGVTYKKGSPEHKKIIEERIESSKIEIGKRIDAGLSTVSSTGLGVFKILICTLIFISLIRLLRDSVASVPTFADLLSLLQNVPQVSDNVLSFTNQLNITTDWGIFNFFRDFINNFTSFTSIIAWVGSGLVDLLLFVLYFVRWIFV